MKKFRYQQLEEDLTRLIEERRYVPHDLLPSYAELRDSYGLSIATITRAFDAMEKKGLIYTIHGKGTYVSPPVRSRKILILYPGDGLYRDSALFLDGAQKYLFKNNRAYLPILLPLNLVRDNPENITFSYPDIKGIIVFRDYSAFVELEEALKNEGLAFLFYGSSMHAPDIRYNSYLYDEEEIAKLMADHLWERGYRRTGGVSFDLGGLGKYRFGLFLKAARARGLKVDEDYLYMGEPQEENFLAWLRSREWNGIPLYASHRSHVLPLFYLLLKAGYSFPDQIGLIGVDRLELSTMQNLAPTFLELPTSRDGRNCIRYLIDIIEGRMGSVRGTSPVCVVPGGTLF